MIGFSKDYRVFSSKNTLLESSPIFQIHKTTKYDSRLVVIGFMQDYIY